ncbi:MAG: prepilin-type N-terminal cleavage/methylation domain-containing protein, partial [Lachnospiraceae bacterium]|nr:prepilin-type N-terminal cleavage/methylation domain-containing protein [Lachnospiraceae bacterium]
MKKIMNKKGFTLAELLVVVAIIAILVAVSIPIFTSQMEKSREATDIANLRAAKGEAVTMYLSDDSFTGGNYDADSGKILTSGTPAKGYGKGTALVGNSANNQFSYQPGTAYTGQYIHVAVDSKGECKF